MKNKVADEIRIRHILDAISDIETFTEKKNFEDFSSDKMLQSACVHQLQIIGEAANHFTREFINKHNNVEWAEIVGLRNLLIHEYFGIDIKLVWQVIQNDIPRLKAHIQNIIENLI
jgi:uncharacterized protein with HEPN domain